MKQPAYKLSFTTPAFLGNAEQNGQWRTPPFKALLRQWWRIAYAADHGFDVDVEAMRREEGLLFGNAWLSHREGGREVADHRKSLVRIRLDRWAGGTLKSWQGLEQRAVFHPEVERTNYQVGPHAYLGYGPLDGRGNTQLDKKRNAAIQAGDSAVLSIAYPETHLDPTIRRIVDDNIGRIPRVLWLMDRYGTLGSRSRNGWGSIKLTPKNGAPQLAGNVPMRPWREALAPKWDWPHSIGRDDKGALVWQTRPFDDWKSLMRELAIIRIGLRTQFVFPNVRPPHANVDARHWLSYPITTHATRAWDRNARLPNSLRFKVRPAADNAKQVVGVISHLPCLPPPEFHPDRTSIIRTWQGVHALLDELTKPVESRSYSSIDDPERRRRLKPQLESVKLIRIAE